MVHPFFASDLDKVRVAHLADVMVNRLRGEAELRRDLADRHLLRPKQIDDPPPGFVGQELERLRILDDLECLHRSPPEQCLCSIINVSITETKALLTTIK